MNFHPCDVSHIDHFDWKLPTKVTDATIESVYEFLKQLIKFSLSIFPKFILESNCYMLNIEKNQCLFTIKAKVLIY